MNRAADVLADPQLLFRRVFTELRHPLIDGPVPSDTGPAPFQHIPPAPLRPAPGPGEHTRMVCRTVLGLPETEIDRLIADGVLFTDEGRIEGGSDGQDGRGVHRRAVPRR
jgi:crotonobetainyl-CoA:carnitine CoA-transferase CaiB-like acyl-CoA transferase